MFNRVIDNYRLYKNGDYSTILNDNTIFKDDFFDISNMDYTKANAAWTNIQNPSWGTKVKFPLTLPSPPPKIVQHSITVDSTSEESDKPTKKKRKQKAKSKVVKTIFEDDESTRSKKNNTKRNRNERESDTAEKKQSKKKQKLEDESEEVDSW
jgi:hypothetical protein